MRGEGCGPLPARLALAQGPDREVMPRGDRIPSELSAGTITPSRHRCSPQLPALSCL